MIYTEFNPRDYEAHWFATQTNPTLIDRGLPASVESVVINEVLKRHDKWLNKALVDLQYFRCFVERSISLSSMVI
jgi:hypothetical protein